MSQEIGFNQTLRVGGRKLHIQTQFDHDTRKVQTAIFDGGKVIDTREYFIEEEMAPASLDAEVRQFHDLVVSDLELLFHVVNKIKSTKNSSALLKLGKMFLEKGFIDEAIETLKTLNKLDPNCREVYIHLGRAFFQKGDYVAAQENLKQACDNDPNYPDVHVLLAGVYRKIQEPIQAMEALQKALALNADYVRAHLLLGLVLAESTLTLPTHPELAPPIERIKESKKHLQYALTQLDEHQRNKLISSIEKMDSREGLVESLAEIEKAIDPTIFNHHRMMVDGEFYLKFMFADLEQNRKTLDNYIKILEKAVAKHPNYADVRHSLGTAYLLRGWHNFAKALESYREAVKINPQYKKAKTNMRLLENEARGFLILLRSVLK